MMAEPVLIPTTNIISNNVGMENVHEIINASACENTEIQVAKKSTGKRNLKIPKENQKKTVNGTKRKSKNAKEQTTKSDGDKMITGENIGNSEQTKNQSGKNRKRKSATKEKSESINEQENEDETTAENVNGDNLEANENDMENPKRKLPRKEMPQASTSKKTDDVANAVDISAKKSMKTKSDNGQNSKNKTAVHPPTSEMVLDCFRNLKNRSGSSLEEITKYIDENYNVNISRIKPHIKKFLQKGVADGLFDQVSKRGADIKFKIMKEGKGNKATEKVKKATDKVMNRAGKVQVAAERNTKRRRSMTRKAKNVKKATDKVMKRARKVKVATGRNTKRRSMARKAKNVKNAGSKKTKRVVTRISAK